MADYSTRPLDAGTWPDFARLVEAHNGVWALRSSMSSLTARMTG